MDEKIIKILEALIQNTRNDKIIWEESGTNETFIANTKEFKLILTHAPSTKFNEIAETLLGIYDVNFKLIQYVSYIASNKENKIIANLLLSLKNQVFNKKYGDSDPLDKLLIDLI